MREVSARSVAQQRFLATMLLVFAGVGLVFAVVGVYGVMAQLAADREREMGIRVALGARAAQVQWLVVRRGLAARDGRRRRRPRRGASSRRARVRALLFGVGAWDPATFVAVPLILIVTAVARDLDPRTDARAAPIRWRR